MYYLNSRYYDSNTGRFINPDDYTVIGATPMGLTDKNLYAYCDNNPIIRADDGGEFWNVIAGAFVGAAIGLVTSVASEIIEGDITWKDVGQIAISTGIGAIEGGAMAACPIAAAAISAAASVTETAINGLIDGDSAQKIITDSLISGSIGAITGSAGSGFAGKGGELINNAANAFVRNTKKGVHPAVKRSANKVIKKAVRYIGKQYFNGQIEDFAYWGVNEFGSFYSNGIVNMYFGR